MKGKSPETVSNYRSLACHHLTPYLGAARLKKLTADELELVSGGGYVGPAAKATGTAPPPPVTVRDVLLCGFLAS